MKVTPIKNGIFFVFEDQVDRNGVFEEKTTWNFTLKNDPSTTVKRARWGRVVATGHEVGKQIRVGDMVLIEPLKWTNRLEFEGKEFWKTDSDHILAIREG